MHDTLGSSNSGIEYIVRVITLVITIVNALVSFSAMVIWRSFQNFKRDVKDNMTEYFEREGKTRLELQENIESIEKKIIDVEISVVKLNGKLKEMKTLCDERHKRKR